MNGSLIEPRPEYSKTFVDELDWTLFDQFHKVVLQISTFCFRTKQICLTVDIAVVGLLAKFTDSSVNDSMFVAGLIIPLCFWFLDAVAYYYQVKLRGIMDNIQERLCERNTLHLVDFNLRNVIEKKRLEKATWERILDSFLNHSMWLYLFLILADIFLFIAFKQGWIR